MHSNVNVLKFTPVQTIFSDPLKQSTKQLINTSIPYRPFSVRNHIKENGLLNICTLHYKTHKYCHKICGLSTKISTHYRIPICFQRPPLWSTGQSFWLQIQRSRVRFPALPDFMSSSGSGTGSTQPREVN